MLPLIERCLDLPFLSNLSDDTLADVADRARWYCLAGGEALFAQDSPSEALYIVMAGRLIVVRRRNGEEEVVGYARGGESIGEMSLMSGGAHTASAFALRDTELLALPAEDFKTLLETRADFASLMVRTIVQRARRPSASFVHAPPKVFALIATSPSVDVEAIARSLSERVAQLGKRVETLLDAPRGDKEAAFSDLDQRADIVLLACRMGGSAWYRFVLRHADRFLVFARRDARPPRPMPLSPSPESPARKFRLVDLVVVHEGQPRGAIADWVAEADSSRTFHWADENSRMRLARAIAGETIGLVLSGGGARAYAQIGVLRAMAELGLTVDFVGGASMGAIIGACLAMGWDVDEIDERIRDGFVSSSPLSDHVLPVVAMTRGRVVEARLEKHFGEAMIEDMPLPFYCVSSELTRGLVRVHRRGLVRRALRASISLPGVLPPVVDGHELLVDGAVMNNFPTDIMVNFHRGLTVGVDVARRGSISAAAFVDPPSFIGWVRRHGIRAAPPVVSLLMRAATARGPDDQHGDKPDILITPAVPNVELRDWKQYDAAVEDGYRAALAAFERADNLVAAFRRPANGRQGRLAATDM